MIQVKSIKAQTSSLILFSHIIVATVTAGSWYIMLFVLDISDYVAVPLGFIIGILLAVLFTVALERAISLPLDMITQAILHVSQEESRTPAPKPETAWYGREYLEQIIGKIYDIGAGQEHLRSKVTTEHNFMHAVLSTMPLPVVVLGHDQKVKYLNQSAEKYVFGLEDATNHAFDEVYNLKFSTSQNFADWIRDCQENKIRETKSWERVTLETTSHKKYVFDIMAHYNKNDPNDIETILMFFDHTDHYMADDNEISFVSLALHELRGPLTVLRGYIEVFEDELRPKLDDEEQEFMHKMNISAAQLATFVNNILNVARIDNDQMKVHLREEDWGAMLKSVTDDLRLRASVRNRRLKLQVADKLPQVAVDNVSIYEVLSNLIDNAIKYSKDNGEIIVSTYEKDGVIETTVQDSGIGIPSSLLENLFDKFYRSHRSRENVGGTGLGLYLSKSIVEAHGGQIWVKSIEGQGSTFGFTLRKYEDVADELKSKDTSNGSIVRSGHGWIKNHSMIRK